jgi:regulatory protein
MKAARSRSTSSDDAQAAYLVALRLLAGRDTESAMLRKLHGRGFPQEEIEKALQRLKSEGFIDDRRYAVRFIESCQASGRYVGYRLVQELRRRGISRAVYDQLLLDRQGQADETGLAEELVKRKYQDFGHVPLDDRTRRRIAGFLQRRGFGADTVCRVLSHRTQE